MFTFICTEEEWASADRVKQNWAIREMPDVQVTRFSREWTGDDLTVMVECSPEEAFDLSRLLHQEIAELASHEQQEARTNRLRSLERRLNRCLLTA